MNATLSAIPYAFGESKVRVLMRGEAPWFAASDVCAALDYKNTSKAVADHLDDDERYNQPLERGGTLVLINESGLYALVLRSRKPEARKFAKWVTSEVLPSIRKSGGYKVSELHTKAMELTMLASGLIQASLYKGIVDEAVPLSRTQWALSFKDESGGLVPTVTRVAENAYMHAPQMMANHIRNGGVKMSSQDLTALAEACIDSLGKMAGSISSRRQAALTF